jgi:hypothetical protein
MVAKQPPHRQHDQHLPPAHRGIGQPPPVAAVRPAGQGPAARACCLAITGARQDADESRGRLDAFDLDAGKVRQEGVKALMVTCAI